MLVVDMLEKLCRVESLLAQRTRYFGVPRSTWPSIDLQRSHDLRLASVEARLEVFVQVSESIGEILLIVGNGIIQITSRALEPSVRNRLLRTEVSISRSVTTQSLSANLPGQ